MSDPGRDRRGCLLGRSHIMDVHADVERDVGGKREIVLYILWGKCWSKVDMRK